MSVEFEYEKVKGGIRLLKYIGDTNQETVIVPDNIDGENVVIIGAQCFPKFNSVKNIVLPDTLKKIEFLAFGCFGKLVEIIIPNSVEEIESRAFNDCLELKSVVLPPNLKTIKKSLFSLSRNLEKVEFPKTLESIEEYAFIGCKKLKEITLPNTLQTISLRAFDDCEELTKVVIDNPNIKVHSKAFLGANKLEDVPLYLFKQLDVNTQQVLNFCTFMSNKWEQLSKDEQKDFISYIKRGKKVRKALFTQDASIAISIVLREGVKLSLSELNDYIDVSISQEHNSVTAILLDYKNKTYKKEEITEHTEKNELIEIGLDYPTVKEFKAKWTCSNIDGGLRVTGYKGDKEEETIPKQLADGTQIIALAHSKSNNFSPLKKLTINADIVSIGQSTFYCLQTLEEIILPESLQTIGKNAFGECGNLREITIPKNVEVLHSNTFSSCKKLERIHFSYGLKEIEQRLFAHCNQLKEVVFPPSLEVVETQIFSMCSLLERVEFQSDIGDTDTICYLCPNIKEVVINKVAPTTEQLEDAKAKEVAKTLVVETPVSTQAPTLKQLRESWRFSKVKGGSTFTKDKGLIEVEEGLRVSGYKGLSEVVTLPKELDDGTKIVSTSFSNNGAFNPIKKLTIDANITTIGAKTFQYCDLEEINIPESVTKIETSAFLGCRNLKEITIPKSVEVLPTGVFFTCSSLEKVNLSEGLTEIGSGAFNKCTSLTEIIIPSSVTTLKTGNCGGPFSDCTNLKSIIIPENITKIPAHIFRGCINLEKVTMSDNVTSIGDRAFDGCVKLADSDGFVIINNILFDYIGTAEIVIVPDNITQIGRGCFENNKCIKEIIIPDTVISIGEFSFADCPNLEKITLPNSVKSIPAYAFLRCVKLVEVNANPKVRVNANAFNFCTLYLEKNK